MVRPWACVPPFGDERRVARRVDREDLYAAVVVFLDVEPSSVWGEGHADQFALVPGEFGAFRRDAAEGVAEGVAEGCTAMRDGVACEYEAVDPRVAITTVG